MLAENLLNVRTALLGERTPYIGHTHSRVYTTLTEQVAALRHRCDEMENLMPEVVKNGWLCSLQSTCNGRNASRLAGKRTLIG